jgi:hypothetical protein
MSPSRVRRSQRRARRTAARAALRPKLDEQLLHVWEHARWVFVNFCEFFAAPAAIAAREYIAVPHYRAIESWLRSLELLTRRLILAAALAITVVLNPVAPRARKPRQRRRVLVWFDKPATWIARLRIFPHKPAETRVVGPARRDPPRVLRSFPLARRLEAVRRVLAHPDRRAHRLAVKLARIAARNATANEPRRFALRDWDSSKARTRGERFIRTGMDRVMPLIEDRLAAWNERCEPG